MASKKGWSQDARKSAARARSIKQLLGKPAYDLYARTGQYNNAALESARRGKGTQAAQHAAEPPPKPSATAKPARVKKSADVVDSQGVPFDPGSSRDLTDGTTIFRETDGSFSLSKDEGITKKRTTVATVKKKFANVGEHPGSVQATHDMLREHALDPHPATAQAAKDHLKRLGVPVPRKKRNATGTVAEHVEPTRPDGVDAGLSAAVRAGQKDLQPQGKLTRITPDEVGPFDEQVLNDIKERDDASAKLFKDEGGAVFVQYAGPGGERITADIAAEYDARKEEIDRRGVGPQPSLSTPDTLLTGGPKTRVRVSGGGKPDQTMDLAGKPALDVGDLSTGQRRVVSLLDKIYKADEIDPDGLDTQKRSFALQKADKKDIDIAAERIALREGVTKAEVLRTAGGHLDSRNTGMSDKLTNMGDAATRGHAYPGTRDRLSNAFVEDSPGRTSPFATNITLNPDEDQPPTDAEIVDAVDFAASKVTADKMSRIWIGPDQWVDLRHNPDSPDAFSVLDPRVERGGSAEWREPGLTTAHEILKDFRDRQTSGSEYDALSKKYDAGDGLDNMTYEEIARMHDLAPPNEPDTTLLALANEMDKREKAGQAPASASAHLTPEERTDPASMERQRKENEVLDQLLNVEKATSTQIGDITAGYDDTDGFWMRPTSAGTAPGQTKWFEDRGEWEDAVLAAVLPATAGGTTPEPAGGPWVSQFTGEVYPDELSMMLDDFNNGASPELDRGYNLVSYLGDHPEDKQRVVAALATEWVGAGDTALDPKVDADTIKEIQDFARSKGITDPDVMKVLAGDTSPTKGAGLTTHDIILGKAPAPGGASSVGADLNNRIIALSPRVDDPESVRFHEEYYIEDGQFKSTAFDNGYGFDDAVPIEPSAKGFNLPEGLRITGNDDVGPETILPPGEHSTDEIVTALTEHRHSLDLPVPGVGKPPGPGPDPPSQSTVERELQNLDEGGIKELGGGVVIASRLKKVPGEPDQYDYVVMKDQGSGPRAYIGEGSTPEAAAAQSVGHGVFTDELAAQLRGGSALTGPSPDAGPSPGEWASESTGEVYDNPFDPVRDDIKGMAPDTITAWADIFHAMSEKPNDPQGEELLAWHSDGDAQAYGSYADKQDTWEALETARANGITDPKQLARIEAIVQGKNPDKAGSTPKLKKQPAEPAAQKAARQASERLQALYEAKQNDPSAVQKAINWPGTIPEEDRPALTDAALQYAKTSTWKDQEGTPNKFASVDFSSVARALQNGPDGIAQLTDAHFGWNLSEERRAAEANLRQVNEGHLSPDERSRLDGRTPVTASAKNPNFSEYTAAQARDLLADAPPGSAAYLSRSEPGAGGSLIIAAPGGFAASANQIKYGGGYQKVFEEAQFRQQELARLSKQGASR